VNLLTPAGNATAFISIGNIDWSHTAGTRGDCIQNGNTNTNVLFVRDAIFTGCAKAIAGAGGIGAQTITRTVLENVEAKSTTNVTVQVAGQLEIYDSYIHGSVTAGSSGDCIAASGATVVIVERTIIADCARNGLNINAGNQQARLLNVTFSNMVTDCFVMGTTAWGTTFTPLSLKNNIFYGCAGTGVNLSSPTVYVDPTDIFNRNNAYGSNGTDRTNLGAGTNDVALTANPFVSSTNLALNNTAGGGAALKRVGFPGVFPGALTTGYLDIGAVQSSNATQRSYGAAQ